MASHPDSPESAEIPPEITEPVAELAEIPIAPPTAAELETFRLYLRDKKIVIADANKTIRASLAQAMVDLGAKSHNTLLASTVRDAAEAITTLKADIIFADYNLGDQYGLELIEVHRGVRQDIENLLFVLVTGNSQESAVAEAAEEDVDAYILKPFTMESLKRYVIRAGTLKTNPTPYRTRISRGKQHLFAGNPDEALVEFQGAKAINEKPSLACYYEGQAFEAKNEATTSEICYEEGLMYDGIHYKCSVALFDAWTKTGKNQEAYGLIKKLMVHFPLNPQRLCKTIDLAVRTGHYEDVLRYYEVFTRTEERREDLKKYVSAALVVGAIFQFRKGDSTQGLELMNKASISAAGSPAMLQEIALALVENDQAAVAEAVLSRFPMDQRGSREYLVTELAVLDRTQPIGVVVTRGRGLLKAGIQDRLVYRILIRRTMEAGHHDTAEALAHDAGRLWPNERTNFLSLVKR